jgi:hypothetical protein
LAWRGHINEKSFNKGLQDYDNYRKSWLVWSKLFSVNKCWMIMASDVRADIISISLDLVEFRSRGTWHCSSSNRMNNCRQFFTQILISLFRRSNQRPKWLVISLHFVSVWLQYEWLLRRPAILLKACDYWQSCDEARDTLTEAIRRKYQAAWWLNSKQDVPQPHDLIVNISCTSFSICAFIVRFRSSATIVLMTDRSVPELICSNVS